MKNYRRMFLPANKECPGGHTKQTVGDLIKFLSAIPADAPIGAFCHLDEGLRNLEGCRLGLSGVEYRVVDDAEPGSYGREAVLFNIRVDLEDDFYDEDDEDLDHDDNYLLLGDEMDSEDIDREW